MGEWMLEYKLMFKYRIYPGAKQAKRLDAVFAHCKHVWNELLGQNKELWVTHKFDFNNLVLDLKLCDPSIGRDVHAHVLQNVSDRLSKAFTAFFSRVKLRKQGRRVKAGFPRFKRSVSSITFPDSGFKLKGKRLFLSKIGNVPIVLSRPLRGTVKTLTVKRNAAGQWFAVFSCVIDGGTSVHLSSQTVGIDVGLENFAMLSKEDAAIFNPRFFRCSERKLGRAQRRLSRKVKGSKNRAKQRVKVARVHLKVFNQRTDFLHKAANKVARTYRLCKTERLRIKNMVKNHCLAKSILDAGWGRFFNMLSYKEVILGGEHTKVEAANTTTDCSGCGTRIKMPLGKRVFECPKCGLKLHRDKNAAFNIEVKPDTVGLTGISTPVEIPPLRQRLLAAASGVEEAGTICARRPV
jgi:putative transposase